jgi:hypothetical protein
VLQAEIKGTFVPEVRSNEDYLTSAVFGLLKYVSPSVFWPSFLKRAVRQQEDGTSDWLWNRCSEITKCSEVAMEFWKPYDRDDKPGHQNIPDLTVTFTSPEVKLLLLIEVKLEAGKDDAHDPDEDQLVRYALIAEVVAEKYTFAGVVFLTQKDSGSEVGQSIKRLSESNHKSASSRVYSVEWGDVYDATAEACEGSCTITERAILGDIKAFLEKRGLNYFCKWQRLEVPALKPRAIFTEGNPWFRQVALPASIKIQRGTWLHEH